MLKKRLVPTILLQNGQVVKSIGFKEYQIIGNPRVAIRFFNAWAVDEIVFLDTSKKKEYSSLMRSDYNFKTFETFAGIVKDCATICFVPLTVGGGLRTIQDMRELFAVGADKVVTNSEAVRRPAFIAEAAERFGSQAIVVSIDARKKGANSYEVYTEYGSHATGLDPVSWAKKAEELGAGEIYLTSIDRDGSHKGYDLDLLKSVTDAVSIPVIASGGVGKWQDLVDGVQIGKASAVSAANIFHYKEQSTRDAKRYMAEAGLDVRM